MYSRVLICKSNFNHFTCNTPEGPKETKPRTKAKAIQWAALLVSVTFCSFKGTTLFGWSLLAIFWLAKRSPIGQFGSFPQLLIQFIALHSSHTPPFDFVVVDIKFVWTRRRNRSDTGGCAKFENRYVVTRQRQKSTKKVKSPNNFFVLNVKVGIV